MEPDAHGAPPLQPPTNPSGSYYSVFVPGENKPKGLELCKHIFNDRLSALAFVKETKKARFRQFEHYNDALNFATYGLIEQRKRTNIRNGSIIKKETDIFPSFGEKSSPFKGPKPQDLVKLRKSIEVGDYDYVKNTVWQNPRYLVSSGDTPSILQEGFRFNALHVAAKAKNGPIAELILSTISDDRFIRLLYGDDVYDNIENRIQTLLDLYLNTPDRGCNETPLHFAVKFGAVEVVEVLVSFPQCDKTLKNKYAQTPDMIICYRCDKSENVSYMKRQIELLLKNNYYVPVLRDEDSSMPAAIGEPFMSGHSPISSRDLLSPRLEIHAYAGPMEKEEAEKFRKIWKTPPRTSTPVRKNYNSSLDSVISLRYKDHTKGLERLGQKLADQFEVSWKEYWPFLDCFVNIASKEGLSLFEDYLKSRAIILDKSSLSQVIFDDSQKKHSAISELCHALHACKLDDSSFRDDAELDDFEPFLCIERACNVFANRIACDITHRMTKEFHSSVAVIESQVKQVEVLVTSYMEDARFKRVNLKLLHSRLGELTAYKLSYIISDDERPAKIEKLEDFVLEAAKIFDYSSSDDERNYQRATSTKKQMICLVRHVLESFMEGTASGAQLNEEQDCAAAWARAKECGCVFHVKKTRKGLSRNNSFKKFPVKTDLKNVSRKLFSVSGNTSGTPQEESDDSDEFYTPPSSPSELRDSDDDEFNETQLLCELFIEGELPTKTDYAVFNALRYSECEIDAKDYPNVYRWRHTVGLYSESERERWPRVRNLQVANGNQAVSPNMLKSPSSTPHLSKSWLRITGANSPRATRMNSLKN